MLSTCYTLPPPLTTPTAWGWWPDASLDIEMFGSPPPRRFVVLQEPLVWHDPDGTRRVVPSGYVCDGATIPRLAWMVMGGKLSLDYLRSAILHDYTILMARCGSSEEWASSSREAAVRFYRGLRADGMGYHKARTCYYAVEWFGPSWNT